MRIYTVRHLSGTQEIVACNEHAEALMPPVDGERLTARAAADGDGGLECIFCRAQSGGPAYRPLVAGRPNHLD